MITGKWYESADNIDSVKNGQTIAINPTSGPDGSYLQLNANGTGQVYDTPYGGNSDTTTNITYTLSGSVLTLNYPAYQIYVYLYQAHTTSWTIVSLTSNTLNLKYTNASGTFIQNVSFKK